MTLHVRILAVGLVATVTWLAPAAAENHKVVDGLAIDIGVMPAAQLLGVDSYERASHRLASAGATHHVVVVVSDARTGKRVDDAVVTLELVDPRGAAQAKTLLRGDPAGAADYSELFRFGWSGDYRLRVKVQRAGAEPAQVAFQWKQAY
jgi:hypothetical protein